MRLIHTADWHLCDRLGRVDRTHDLRDRVKQVAELCESERADVLLIAGDIFSEGAHVTLDVMNAELDELFKVFAAFFVRGGTILAVTGNHDRDARAEMVRLGMRFAAPDGGKVLRAGRMYLMNKPFVGALETRAGEKANFVLVPYPTTVRYGLPGDAFESKADEHRTLNGRVIDWLKEAQPKLDAKSPTVLVGHLHVAGAGLSHTTFRMTEADDILFDTGFLPNWVHYVALGHIHLAQALGGLPHVRYSGGIDRLDMFEREYDTGVVRIDLGPTGLVGEPLVLPVAPTPMCQLHITDPAAELPTLSERVPEREAALVHVTATYVPGGPTRDEIIRAVKAAFPRHTDLVWARADAAAPTGGIKPGADYRATVRTFLDARLTDDPDRDALLNLAETFLTAEAAP